MDTSEWTGVFPASMCPFQDNYQIDEENLAEHLKWLAGFEGITGIVVNGHTGEICSLRNTERARVVEICADAVDGQVKVVSGVCAEGSHDAIDQAIAAKSAGADGILLMPPHHWLRFGRDTKTALGFIQDVAENADVNIVIHQYPSWTKASYSLEEMLEIINFPQVVSIKMGTRDMARQWYDYQAIKRAKPECSILTCHDEYLLPSLLEGADGALVGFAAYAPDLICQLVKCAMAGDLAGARAIRQQIDHLALAIYRFGEPSAEAHQRMKMAAYLTGKLKSSVCRPPLRPLSQNTIEEMKVDLEKAGEKIVLQVG